MMSERAVLPDIGKLDQDPMSQVGYPTGVVGFHGLFGCKPLGLLRDIMSDHGMTVKDAVVIMLFASSLRVPNWS